MIKRILNSIWTFSLKKGWDWIWSKTEIDEKAEAFVIETKFRIERVKEELFDVKTELNHALKQLNDVKEAAKGKPRRGRPKKKAESNTKK